MQDRKFDSILEVELTPKEVEQKSKRVVGLLHDEAEEIAARKDAMAVYKSRIEVIVTERVALAEQCRTGVERRPVECTRRKDFDRGLMLSIRLDTGEEFQTRPLEQEERQPALAPKVTDEELPSVVTIADLASMCDKSVRQVRRVAGDLEPDHVGRWQWPVGDEKLTPLFASLGLVVDDKTGEVSLAETTSD